jgi:hypothetical protein
MADALSRGESVPGGPGACADCGHLTLWHGEHGRYRGRPCRRCACPAFREPGTDPEPPRQQRARKPRELPGQLVLFTLDEVP